MSLGTLLLIVIGALVGFIIGELHGSKHLKVTSIICGFLVLLCFFFTAMF